MTSRPSDPGSFHDDRHALGRPRFLRDRRVDCKREPEDHIYVKLEEVWITCSTRPSARP